MSRTSPERDDAAEPDASDERSASGLLSAVLVLLLLGGAGAVSAWLFSTEPTAEKAGASKQTAMLVDVVRVERGTHRPRIEAQGTVRPARDVELRPQVGGRVVSTSPSLVPGGDVEAGERLLRIEPADYRHALARRESELRRAEADLAVARGRHEAAEDEYGRFGEEVSPKNEALVVREPQLRAAEERVEAARTAVDQAELELSRTAVEAPFDAHVVRRDVNVGSQLSPGDPIARLIGIETYWVAVELPLSKLRWVTIPGDDGDQGAGGVEGEAPDEGSAVRVRNDRAWPPGTFREGHLFERVGVLDESTRMARVLAAIPDPLAREDDDPDTPALTVGAFVDVRIAGTSLEDVVRLDRDLVRDEETVWVMAGGELRVREVEIVVRDAEHAYVAEGLADGARVVTTNLSTVEEGAPLRLKGSDGSEEEASGE